MLGGTVHYQDTISMEKNSFGVTPKTGGHQPLAPLVLRLYMYCIYYHIRIVFSELHCIDHGFESMHLLPFFFYIVKFSKFSKKSRNCQFTKHCLSHKYMSVQNILTVHTLFIMNQTFL